MAADNTPTCRHALNTLSLTLPCSTSKNYYPATTQITLLHQQVFLPCHHSKKMPFLIRP